MKSQRIPLVGSPVFRNSNVYNYDTSTYQIDQIFQDCFVELTKNPISGSARLALNKRAGFSKSVVAGASYQGTTAGTVWSGYSGGIKGAFAYNNGTNVTVYDTGGAIIGALFVGPNGGHWLSETLISNVSNLVLTGYDTGTGEWQAWFYPEAGAWTKITDVDFPGTPVGSGGLGLALTNGAVHMDGFMFVMTRSGLIYNSDVNSLANWTATNFVAAQFSPDLAVGINKIKNYVVAFSEGSIEFFARNDSAVGSPLTRIPGSSLKIGAYVPFYSYPASQAVGDALYFIGKNLENGALGVYRTTGPGALQKISNIAIDKWCMEWASLPSTFYISGSFSMLGMQHLVITNRFSAAGSSVFRHMVYCIDSGTWWALNLPSNVNPTAFSGFNGNSFFTTLDVATSNGRNLYTCDARLPVYQDDGANYTMSMQIGPLDHGTYRKKYFHSFALIADTQTTSGDVSVTWSDDGESTFSSARTIDTSTTAKRIHRLGSSRRRIWKLTESVNRPFRADAIELTYEEGTT